MRKTVAILMCFTLILLAACGSNGNNKANPSPDKTTPPTSAAENKPTPEKQEEKPIKLRIYAQYADEDTKTPYDYAIAELKKEMPNVELELDIQAQDDGQKLKTYAATGNLPDIFQAGLDIINTFKQSNNILVLNDYLDTYDFESKMHASTMNTLWTDDGNVYAFPYAGNEFMLWYYNKELFEKYNVKVPETVDELKTAIKVFNDNGIIPMSLFAKEKWPDVALFDAFATRLNPKGILALDRGEAKASDEAFVKAAQTIQELVKDGLLPKGATNLNYDQAAALFHEGKAAMFLNGQWEIEASTKALGDKVDWMYYPAYDKETYEKAKMNFSGGGGPSGYAVNPNSEHKEIAVKVAAFLSLKYAEYKYTDRGNPLVATKVDLPINKPYPPMMEKLANDIPNVTSTSAFAWGISQPSFKAQLEDNAQSLLTGFFEVDEFISGIDRVLEGQK